MASGEIRVLIVDDNRSLARSLAELLRRRAFRTFLAHRAAAAVRMARRFRPHVVVADVQLPDSAGPELLEGLARVAPETRVILISAGGSAALGAPLRRVFGRLDKPFDPLRLVALVRRAAEDLLKTFSATALPLALPSRAGTGRFALVPLRRLLPAGPRAAASLTLVPARTRSRVLALRMVRKAAAWTGPAGND